METVDALVVGAGVVGLAVAERLSRDGLEVVVAERHDGFGRDTSSRNSEVIHAGIYYPDNSLKARLCVEGNRKLHAFCADYGIPHKQVGKVVVGNTPEEVAKVEEIHAQGVRNGVEGLEMLSPDRIKTMEPNIRAAAALWCPTSGILDTHALMKRLEALAESHGTTTAYCCEVIGIARGGDGYEVTLRDADGEDMEILAGAVVNSAGLKSDYVAAMAGIDIKSAGYELHLCKGEYFSVSNRHRGKLNHLVYPCPTDISLGVHAVLGLDGALRLGPNAFYVDEVEYAVNEEHLREFADSARAFMPFIDKDDLAPDQAGVRPKLQGPNSKFRDFVIEEESGRGLPGLVNLIGIESPGLTACLSIADEVAKRLGRD